MKQDLNKELCEHERARSWDKFHNYRHRKDFKIADEDGELGGRESMKVRYVNGWNNKEFGENLNPLWGAVRKAVGKPWNKFYSELCKTFDKRSVINQHILVHLFQEVEVNTYVGEDGQVWVRGRYNGNEPLSKAYCQYYVDPRDGILKKNKHYKSYRHAQRQRAAEEQAKKDKVTRVIDKDNVLHFIDGVWYHYTLADVPESTVTYTKPFGVEEFKPNSYEKRALCWEELSDFEKARFGTPVFHGDVLDVFTNQRVVKMLKNSPRGHRGAYSVGQASRYHASKKTASHATLKKAGLV